MYHLWKLNPQWYQVVQILLGWNLGVVVVVGVVVEVVVIGVVVVEVVIIVVDGFVGRPKPTPRLTPVNTIMIAIDTKAILFPEKQWAWIFYR